MRMVHSPSNNSDLQAESADDWVFSLIAPSVDSTNEDDASGTTQRVLVQLRGTGGNKSDVESSVLSSSDSFLDRSMSLADSPKMQQQEPPLSGETVSLLDQFDFSDSNRSGWNWNGPNWSIGSSVLLKVTHRPAWQALPEYTQMSVARDCCRRWCCQTKSRPVYHATDIYKTTDIARVEQDLMIGIRGIGACRAVRLFLRKHLFTPVMAPTLQLRIALEKQWNLGPNITNFDRFGEEADSMPLPPWRRPEDVSNHDGGPILTFAIPLDHEEHGPPLLWKVELPPNKHIAIETWTVLDGLLNPHQEDTHHPSHLYINGYQSWSFAGSVAKGEPQPTSALPNVFSRAFNNGGRPPPASADTLGTYTEVEEQLWDERGGAQPETTKQKHSGYQSDFFTCITSDAASAYRESPRLLDEWGGPALVLGWLSQHYQFGVVTVDANLEKVAMHASAEGQIWKRGGCTDWAYAQLVAPHNYDEEPMVHYLHDVAAHNEAKPLQNGSLLTGWCSWYHYYEKISAANLRENFKTLHALRNKLPTNVAVVDDGYMTAWGDWDSLKPKEFPDSEGGLQVVSRDIRDKSMRPGVWMAPFACDRFSQLAKKHPDWIIRNDEGRNANSSNCGKFFFGLDATNPHVRDYVFSCVKRAVEEWGFDVLKIDFLYSACLAGNGKHDLSISRAEAMHMALQTIRAAAGPDTFLIGCGCPIGTGVGYVDGMRVSADTGPTWYPAFPFPWWDHGTLPALRSMIRNSMSRACMGHRWWHNDPDCLLFGESTSLNDHEVASAASVVAMTCGMLLLSDDLTKLSLSRLRILTKIYPMTGAAAVVLDLHSSSDGMPCLLRLWCTDRYNLAPYGINGLNSLGDDTTKDHNAEATFFGRYASFCLDERRPQPSERKRNCIHVANGLGTWTLLSLSNWLDKPAVVYAPSQALHRPPETGWESEDDNHILTGRSNKIATSKYGYHAFAFWSSNYMWMPDESQESDVEKRTLSKHLDPHATEIFHIKPVSLNMPQYIGSDLHFSCGYEVRSFKSSVRSVTVCLKNDWNRVGSVFIYVPRLGMDDVVVTVNGVAVTRKPGGWDVVANTPRHNGKNGPTCLGRIIRIWVAVHADQSEHDGEISVKF